MANAAEPEAVITENLHDIGLDEAGIAACLQMIREQRCTELDRFLQAYRRTLLDGMHRYSERLDCLDYLTYTLRKNGGI